MNHLVQRGVRFGLLTAIFLLIVLCLYYLSLQMDIELPALREREASLGSIRTKSDGFSGGNSKLLPQTVIDRVNTFVFFVGHGRSGHSIVGSLMDSHPHMVISHELDLFKKLSHGLLAPTKSAIFNAIWENTKQTINASLNASMESAIRARSNKGYTLLVDGLYQGKYVDYVDVIGDKKAGSTTEKFYTQPEKWKRVFNILTSLGVTLKVIHVIRNPYDNIATLALLSSSKTHKQFSTIKESNKTYQLKTEIPVTMEMVIRFSSIF